MGQSESGGKIFKKIWFELLEIIKIVIYSFIFVSILSNFFIKPVVIDGSSMYPTLNDNEVGFSNIIGLQLNGVERFDIVIVYHEQSEDYFVKRVIGLPNEEIEYKNDILYIDGIATDEPFLNEAYMNNYASTYPFTMDVEKIKLGSDQYYLLGDNRPYSSDSRYFGPFNSDSIVAKDIVVVYPFKSFGIK